MTTIEASYHAIFREANDPGTSGTRLIELARSEFELVRGAVALNISSPAEALALLRNDESDHVNNCLADRNSFIKQSDPLAHRASSKFH